MYIPITLKNIILSLTTRRFVVYLACLVPEIFGFGSLYTMLGLGIKNFSSALGKEGFANQTPLMKAKIVIGYLVVIFTVTALVAISCHTKRRIREYEAKERTAEKAEIDEEISIENLEEESI